MQKHLKIGTHGRPGRPPTDEHLLHVHAIREHMAHGCGQP
jgi:hypothetical protein